MGGAVSVLRGAPQLAGRHEDWMHLDPGGLSGHAETQAFTAEARRLDELFSEVDVLKVDAEGHEPCVLRGAGGLLAGRHVGLLLFKVSAAWRRLPGCAGSLAQVTAELHGLGTLVCCSS